jgi:hypothetical protein
MNTSHFFYNLQHGDAFAGYVIHRKKTTFFFKKIKKMLDIPHGGIVCLNSPVRVLLKVTQCLSPMGGSYPREPPFYFVSESDQMVSIPRESLLIHLLRGSIFSIGLSPPAEFRKRRDSRFCGEQCLPI